MKLKKHFYKELGMELFTTEEASFLDNESPVFNELSKDEFRGLVKGLNIMYETPHYSSESKEFKDLRTQFEKEFLKDDEESVASWMGVFMGFRAIKKKNLAIK